MPAARYWRLIGLETYAGDDLEISELHLYGVSERIDAAATFTATVAPFAGALSNLQDDDIETTCRFAAEAVRAGGFSFVWDFGLGNTAVAIGVRLGAADGADTFLAACTLQYSMDGAQWSYLGEFNRYEYPGARQFTLAPKLGDLYYASVEALLHFDGADGSTTFTDNSPVPKTFTAAGSAQISTVQSKFGESSAFFDGTSGYLECPMLSVLDFGNGDFTVEFSIYLLERRNYAIFLGKGDSVATSLPFLVSFNSTGQRAQFAIGGLGNTWNILEAGVVLPLNQWVHLAAVRSGNTFLLFQDGVLTGSMVRSGPLLVNNLPVTVFANYGGRSYGKGYMDELRITKSVARYTQSFALPTEAFPVAHGGAIFINPARHVPTPVHPIVAATSPVGPCTTSSAPKLQTACDMEFGGSFKVYGSVARNETPANVPLIRRVRLHRSRDGMLVRETWSKADGSYEFTEISGRYEYDVIAWDHEMQFRSVVANNLVPEVMP